MGRQFKPGQLETGSLYDISSSFAISSSHTNGTFIGAGTGSFSGSFFGNGNGIFSGSFSGSITANLQQVTDNGRITTNAITASGLQTTQLEIAGVNYISTSASFDTRITSLELFSSSLDATYATDLELNAATASLSSSISNVSSSFNSFTQTYTTGSFTGSFIGDGSQLTGIVSSKWSGSNPITRQSDVEITGSLRVQGSITGSLFGTSSWAINAISASFATSASRAISSSFATSASWAPDTTFPYTGSAIISGSLTVTGSTNLFGPTATTVFSSNADTLVVTGSILLTGSMNVVGLITGTSSYALEALTSSFATTSISSSFSFNSISASFAVSSSYIDGGFF